MTPLEAALQRTDEEIRFAEKYRAGLQAEVEAAAERYDAAVEVPDDEPDELDAFYGRRGFPRRDEWERDW